MGLGVWAMHFIGMLSFDLPVAINYDLAVTAVSVVPVIMASGITIHVLSGTPSGLRLTRVGAPHDGDVARRVGGMPGSSSRASGA
jgi:NO-binding membrane sensor protein with MHYT domain